jgi:superfamily II DNA or RNA helicase
LNLNIYKNKAIVSLKILLMYNRSKIESRANKLFSNFDKDFVDVNFKPHIEQKILKYQTIHILNFISIFKKDNEVCAVDFSSTGTGKTYTAIALCAQLDYEPIIICPKSVICYWKDVCDFFDVKPRTIINYEAIKNGKELDDNMTKKKSDIVDLTEKGFVWKNINKNKNIILFDEAHRCKNHKSLNGKLLLSVKGKCRILLLSATIAQKYDDFKIFGYMLGFYKQMKQGTKWIQSLIREEMFKLSNNNNSQLTTAIYPKKGSRMTYSDMSKFVSPNHITTQCYYLDDKNEEIMKNEYEFLKKNTNHPLTEQLKARQKIEEIKIPILVDLAEKYLEEGNSVVIFVNFLLSLDHLLKYFAKKNIDCSCVFGDQTIEERTNHINKFQDNTVKLILCMIQAGSESISLHDLDGNHPRVSLISPSFSGKELLQSLGRIYRTGVKSRVEQKIIFCDVKIERQICEKIKEKVQFMNNFADYDKLDPDDFSIKL